MKYLRKLILAPVACLALIGGVTPPSQAAHPPTVPSHSPGHSRVYWVYYRSSPHHAWVCYGGYYRQDQAVQAVNYFRHRGSDSFYR